MAEKSMASGQITHWPMNIHQPGIDYQEMQKKGLLNAHYLHIKYWKHKSSSRYHITAESAKAETVSLTIITVELNLYGNQIPMGLKE